MRLRKHILITGATGGVGAATAIALASPEVLLSLHYHSNKKQAEAVRQTCQQLGAEVYLIQSNLRLENGVSDLSKQLHVPVDTLIYTAGHSLQGLLTDLTDMELMDLMSVHLLSPIKLTRALLPHMVRGKMGKIIMISSIWGVTGASYEVAYSAVKGGLNSFVKALAKEVAPSGIQVNAIAPGAIETSMMAVYEPEEQQLIKDEIPAGRFGKPEEIADAISFLVSDQSNYINGQIIEINGAWH
ncbi:elongation factor P 5-aminopentanone reductase [Alkalihalobacillus sp. NPDC078783]